MSGGNLAPRDRREQTVEVWPVVSSRVIILAGCVQQTFAWSDSDRKNRLSDYKCILLSMSPRRFHASIKQTKLLKSIYKVLIRHVQSKKNCLSSNEQQATLRHHADVDNASSLHTIWSCLCVCKSGNINPKFEMLFEIWLQICVAQASLKVMDITKFWIELNFWITFIFLKYIKC